MEFAQCQNCSGGISLVMIENSRKMSAHEWWQQNGYSTPMLRWLGMRALSQTVSASCSEQAWSEYDFIHNRRRNRLTKERADMLVKGHCQARLVRRMRDVNHRQK